MKVRGIILSAFVLWGNLSVTAQIVVPEDETDSLVRQTADTIPPAEKVLNMIDRALQNYPLFTESLADSLDLSVEDFNDLSRRKKKKLVAEFFGNQVKELNNTDSLYIAPQQYDYAFMLQSTTTYENFIISSTEDGGTSLRFAPNPTLRAGGYFGWRWLFLGYTYDAKGLIGGKHHKSKKTEFDLSIYTSLIGLDFYYRKTGNDFRCTNLNSLFDDEHPRPEGVSDDFSGLDIHTYGFNTYYIFNHRHFSYPAAFSQSTQQRRSCGSFKLGFSFTHHRVSLNENAIDPRIKPLISPGMFFNTVKYNDYSINFGYAYNWVFKRDWLFCASFSPGLAYNVTHYNQEEEDSNLPKESRFTHFSFDKLNIDSILRLGLVYNNSKYFAGASFIMHSFDYKNKFVRLNNSFGSFNVYAGLNFKKKKKP